MSPTMYADIFKRGGWVMLVYIAYFFFYFSITTQNDDFVLIVFTLLGVPFMFFVLHTQIQLGAFRTMSTLPFSRYEICKGLWALGVLTPMLVYQLGIIGGSIELLLSGRSLADTMRVWFQFTAIGTIIICVIFNVMLPLPAGSGPYRTGIVALRLLRAAYPLGILSIWWSISLYPSKGPDAYWITSGQLFFLASACAIAELALTFQTTPVFLSRHLSSKNQTSAAAKPAIEHSQPAKAAPVRSSRLSIMDRLLCNPLRILLLMTALMAALTVWIQDQFSMGRWLAWQFRQTIQLGTYDQIMWNQYAFKWIPIYTLLLCFGICVFSLMKFNGNLRAFASLPIRRRTVWFYIMASGLLMFSFLITMNPVWETWLIYGFMTGLILIGYAVSLRWNNIVSAIVMNCIMLVIGLGLWLVWDSATETYMLYMTSTVSIAGILGCGTWVWFLLHNSNAPYLSKPRF